MSPKSKTILGAALAAAMIAVLGAAAAEAATDKPIYVAVGATARAPIGWVEFCNEMPKECAGVNERAARRRAHRQGLEGPRPRQQVGQRQHQADDRHGSLGRGREVVLSR